MVIVYGSSTAVPITTISQEQHKQTSVSTSGTFNLKKNFFLKSKEKQEYAPISVVSCVFGAEFLSSPQNELQVEKRCVGAILKFIIPLQPEQ